MDDKESFGTWNMKHGSICNHLECTSTWGVVWVHPGHCTRPFGGGFRLLLADPWRRGEREHTKVPSTGTPPGRGLGSQGDIHLPLPKGGHPRLPTPNTQHPMLLCGTFLQMGQNTCVRMSIVWFSFCFRFVKIGQQMGGKKTHLHCNLL